MGWPAADIEMDEEAVRSLLADQHPDLADLRLVEVDAGWVPYVREQADAQGAQSAQEGTTSNQKRYVAPTST